MRKKVFLTLSVIFMLGTGVIAQPVPGTNPTSDNATPSGGGMANTGIHRTTNPLAPATLLLIAMAGGYAGVRLYHNSKNNTKE